MIIVIISSFPIIIRTLQLQQKVMAHIAPSEGAKVSGDDVTLDLKSNDTKKVNMHSSIPNQVMLVLALTVMITVMVARVQQALSVRGLGEFSRGREAGQSAGKNAAMSKMPFDAEAPPGHNFDWIAGYHVDITKGTTRQETSKL
jgi:hypothetical protein